MKIKKDTINKKMLATAIVGLIAVVYYSAFTMISNQQTASVESSNPNQAASDSTAEDNKQATSPPTDETSDSPKTPIENEKQDTPPANKVVINITSTTTYANEIKIGSLIESITNSGSCKISLKKKDVVITKSSGIQALPNASTCKGFTIPRAELSDGTWLITLSVTINSKTGTATKTYEIK